ncbi:MAG: hypothetical protein COB93_00045 [Sneathiella sp.]|nr:MAG: hypothetical protein COB93_00045 [Sneathiella sp.]
MGEYRLDYLVRRGHQFYFRRAVPSPVIPYLNKTEINLSLQTCRPEKRLPLPVIPHPRKGSDSYDILCEGILRARIEQGRIYRAMLSGNYDQIEPNDPLFKVPFETAEGNSPKIGLGLRELVEQFIRLKSASMWVAKTTADHKRVLAWFQLMVGSEIPITSITKGHVEKFRDLIYG